jgi:hypothetical protein
MKQEAPLIHKLASHHVQKQAEQNPVIYDPKTQTGILYMGKSTSCAKGTDGTKPKDEADQVMDD